MKKLPILSALVVLLVSLAVVAPVAADPPAWATFEFPSGSLTTSNLNPWSGVSGVTYPVAFNVDAAGVGNLGLRLYVYDLDMSQVIYGGSWGWPPTPDDLGGLVAAGMTGSTAVEFDRQNAAWFQLHSALGTENTWEQGAAPWDPVDQANYRKYLLQAWHRGMTGGKVFPDGPNNHQYNVERYMGPAGRPELGCAGYVPDPEYDTFDLQIDLTPLGGGQYKMEGWIKLHKASSWDEMICKPHPFKWQWNAAMNNDGQPNPAWIKIGGHMPPAQQYRTISNVDFSAVFPFINIANWGTTQTNLHTVTWGKVVVNGVPAATAVAWVDDDWVGTPNGTEVAPGQYFGYNAFATVQDGVNAVVPGGTVHVAAGTYAEQVTLTPGKDLTIVGAGCDEVTWVCPAGGYCIDGSMSGYTGPMNYEISGFKFNVRSEATTTHGTGIGIRKARNGPLTLSIHDNCFVEDLASGDDTHWGTSMLLCHNRFAARDSSGNAAVRVYNNLDETWGGMTMSNSQAYDIYNNVFDGCSDAIYNGHGCPDVAGQTFGDHHIYGNVFRNASDALHPGGLTPAIDWQYYGAGGGTHLSSTIENNLFENNDTAMRFVMDTDMTYPAHVVTNNSFIGNGLSLRVDGAHVSTLDASGNWWGTNGPAGVAAEVSGNVDYTPWLHTGTDTSGDPGFQGDFSMLHVDDDSPQTGSTGRIQEGINLVSGSTIYVAAGTYNERVTINKPLDLRGAQFGVDPTPAGARTNPANESTITEAGLSTPNPDVLIEIPNGVTDVTVDGFTLIGDPTNPIADTSVVRCWDDNITISNNIIDGKYAVLYKGNDTLTVHRNRMVVNKLGVTVQPNPATNVTVTDNTFNLGSNPAGDESAIYMTACSHCSATGNTATAFVNGKGLAGSNLSQLTVSGNTFTGNKDAVSIWGGSTHITIRDNDLSSSLRYGINIKGQDVNITRNKIRNNSDVGINVTHHMIDTERVEIHQNNIVGNMNYGVKVDTTAVTEIVNASCNWWDAVNGPSSSGPGSGDAVSDKVAFQPWLTQAAPSECDYEGPLTSNVVANPVPVGSPGTVTATVDDSGTGGSTIASAECSLDGGGWQPMLASDGAFDEVTEDVKATLPAFSEPGVHEVCVRGTDLAGNVGQPECTLLAVYDPSAGFVTGGGWIWSPAGAYTPDPELEGKATFGFVAKYKKGAQTPEGQTEFVFKAADLNFHSSSYDWLVVAGVRAKFKGIGTINGEGGFKFMLTALDADINKSDTFDVDRFRIKIWYEVNDTEYVVYDNGLGADDADDNAAIEIGGGSIVIHTKK